MIGSKFAKVLILGISITVFSSGAAFAADPGSGQSAVVEAQQTVIEKELLEKQKEIDLYVFEQHAKEIADKGFMVTHTAPIDNYVEIGITPYNEANADYLYKAFGKELVKVIEGQQAVTMEFAADGNPADLAAASGPAEVAATSDPAEVAATSSPAESETTSNRGSFILAGVAGATVLGGTMIVANRRRAARR